MSSSQIINRDIRQTTEKKQIYAAIPKVGCNNIEKKEEEDRYTEIKEKTEQQQTLGMCHVAFACDPHDAGADAQDGHVWLAQELASPGQAYNMEGLRESLGTVKAAPAKRHVTSLTWVCAVIVGESGSKPGFLQPILFDTCCNRAFMSDKLYRTLKDEGLICKSHPYIKTVHCQGSCGGRTERQLECKQK